MQRAGGVAAAERRYDRILTQRRVIVATVVACIAVQLLPVVLLPSHGISMRVGMALLALSCAAVGTIARGRGSRSERWRWNVIVVGFGFWSLFWFAAAYVAGDEQYDQVTVKLAALRLLFFVAAVVPVGDEDDTPLFRSIDLAQALLFSTMLTLLVWPSPWSNMAANPDRLFLYAGYFVPPLLAVINLVTQAGGGRQSAKALVIVLSIYAVTSVASLVLQEHYTIGPNAPVWLFGDTAFVAFIFYVGWPAGDRMEAIGTTRSEDLRHLGSFLMILFLIVMAFALGQRSPAAGLATGVVGLVIFAMRGALLQRRYLEARDALVAVERRRSQMLVDVVHEIRSPLGSVLLNTAMLDQGLDQGPDRGLDGARAAGDRQGRLIGQIRTDGARVTTLLNDVLDLERLEAGMIEVAPARHEIAGVIAAAVSIVRPHAVAHAITIVDRADRSLVALVDAGQMSRVLVNILMNAIRFTPSGGVVEISTRAIAGQALVVEVADTGIGIAPDMLATLFGRFSSRRPPVNGAPGSGLGLAISLALVKAVGGSLALRSAPGVGTTAIITMPSTRP